MPHTAALAVLCSCLLFAVCEPSGSSAPTKAQGQDRVVGVTIACSYTFRERDFAGNSRLATRDGTGEYCDPPGAHIVGGILVQIVNNVRAVVTVRTPPGGSYTVESPDTAVE